MGGRAARAAGLIGTGCGDFPGRRQLFPGGREPRDARLGQRGCRGSGGLGKPGAQCGLDRAAPTDGQRLRCGCGVSRGLHIGRRADAGGVLRPRR
ncbi:acetyltransferase (plasmid) [Ralstonia solanacearum]|nr:acetyltransferase [Ralstonia solanacearum]